MTRFS